MIVLKALSTIEKKVKEFAGVLQMPNVRERLLDIGGEPGGETVDQFTARVRSEIARWQQVATAAGIKRQ